jgi:hypothetical protein
VSTHLIEARASIAQTLDDILRSEDDQRYVVCDLSEDDTEILGLYKTAIAYLETKLGRPNYSGKGHVYPTGNAGADPGVFIDDYSHSLQISWWKTARGVFAALVSGHDADTLLCFTVVFRKVAP